MAPPPRTRAALASRGSPAPGAASVSSRWMQGMCAPNAQTHRAAVARHHPARHRPVKEEDMADIERRARTVWEGPLTHGGGTVTLESSGLCGPLPATWASRTERADGKTSPEELIAAAHATCFSMALSYGLARAGTPPARLETEAVCRATHGEGGLHIATITLRVRGDVPGLDADAFRAAAAQAKDGCPVSQALAGNVHVEVVAELA